MTTGSRVAADRLVADRAMATSGLCTDDARVVHDGADVVVDLVPAPLVARVATLTTRLRPDPGVPFGRKVALAGALAAAGAAVVPPAICCRPVRTGTAARCCRYGPAWRCGRSGRARATWARPWRGCTTCSASNRGRRHRRWTPIDDLTAFVAHGGEWGIPAAMLDRLAQQVADLRPRLAGDPRQLHGDPHPGNLLSTPTGWLWGDLEDTCAGPLAWDLACLRSTWQLDGAGRAGRRPPAPLRRRARPVAAAAPAARRGLGFGHRHRAPGVVGEARGRLEALLGG